MRPHFRLLIILPVCIVCAFMYLMMFKGDIQEYSRIKIENEDVKTTLHNMISQTNSSGVLVINEVEGLELTSEEADRFDQLMIKKLERLAEKGTISNFYGYGAAFSTVKEMKDSGDIVPINSITKIPICVAYTIKISCEDMVEMIDMLTEEFSNIHELKADVGHISCTFSLTKMELSANGVEL